METISVLSHKTVANQSCRHLHILPKLFSELLLEPFGSISGFILWYSVRKNTLLRSGYRELKGIVSHFTIVLMS